MVPDGPNTISLKPRDRLDIKPSGKDGEFHVHLTRDGKDLGPIENEDGQITLSKDNPSLTLTGSGRDSTITTPGNDGKKKGDFIPVISIKTASPVTVSGAFISAGDSTQTAIVGTSPVELANLTIEKSKEGNEIIISTEKDTLKNNPEKNRGLSKSAIFLKYVEDEGRNIAGVEKGSAGIQFVNSEDRQKNLFLFEGDGSLSKGRKRYAGFVEDIKEQTEQAFSKGDKREKERLGVPDEIPVEGSKRSKGSSSVDVAAISRQEMRGHGRKLGDAFQSLVNKFGREKEKFSNAPEFEKTLKDAQRIAIGIGQTGTIKSGNADKLVEDMDKLMQQADKISEKDFGYGMAIKQQLEGIKRGTEFQTLTAGAKKDKEEGKDKEQASAEKPLSSIPAGVLAQARAAVDPMVTRQEAVAVSGGDQQVANVTETIVVSGGNRTV